MTHRSSLSKWRPLLFDDFRHKDDLLTPEQHVACQRLVNHYWLSQEPLPDDDDSLAVISKTRDAWKQMRPAVLLTFFQKKRGGWVPRHYDKELEKSVNVSKSKSEAGKKSGAARRNKETQSNICSESKGTSVQHQGTQSNQYSTVQNTNRNKGNAVTQASPPLDAAPDTDQKFDDLVCSAEGGVR